MEKSEISNVLHGKLRFAVHKVLSIWPYVLVAFVSLTCNWFAQLAYYEIVIHHNALAFSGEQTLFDYKTGIIGDVLLLPIINAGILYVLLHRRPILTRFPYVSAILVGLFVDGLLNFLQGFLKLTNWSMPKPYEWDFVSYWHMASFLLQISFVLLFFYTVMRPGKVLNLKVRRITEGILGLMSVFVLLFLYDYLPRQILLDKLAFAIHDLTKLL